MIALVFVILGLTVFVDGYTQNDQSITRSNTIPNNTAQNTALNSTVQKKDEQTNVNTKKDYDGYIGTLKPG